MAVHPFDQRYGVDTGGLIWSEELGSGEKGEYWATGYYGTSPSVFRQAMDRLGLDWEGYTFVDVGCGKGRALMLALGYPFRRVVGVELSAELVGVAKANLGRFGAEWRRDVPVEVAPGDVTRFALPEEPLVVYLYHPFAAPVMREFLSGLETSLRRCPREVYLLYMNPELKKMLGERGSLEMLWHESFALDEEDAAGDRFGSRSEWVMAFRAR